ncbi:telomerase inhibitor [Neocucurbitaria cava]|uniref:PinX1-related protein 1 n=1 Tax=Neocucurbitaria cava TaxID=798079 RepID=A0A9W8Y853_9PLEO|nr:telomerase inhibitor [Neocucurbitaria cava]
MGLAAPKNRSKISNDPQNTTWANNTTRFGHRILTSQGWQPGDSLGATDASHAAHYTAASQSHIRVFLKDDNLGLGAKRGSERAENFGLAGLESILGRLNGKEAEVKKEEERREEIEKRAFVYRKYGMMNFVSGGFLVGDKITKSADIKKELEVKVEIKSEPESDDGKVDKKSKKRKREERAGRDAVEERTAEEPVLKRKKKSMDLREEARKEGSESSIAKKEKKSKKAKASPSSDPEPETSGAPTPVSDPEPLTDKARRKAEKKARKEEKKLKKALKKAAKKAAKSNGDDKDTSSESEGEESTPGASAPSSVSATGTSTPVLTSAGLTFNATNARGMHAVRQRWIRQKKAATMDAQAMKEVC